MQQPFIILHSNDIHGRIEGLARIATLVERTRNEHPDIPVLYFDIGDIEETSVRLSNLTKGVAMHRLLSLSRCDAEVVGNGGIVRYGHQVLPNYAAVASYPLLLANMFTSGGELIAGAQAAATFQVGACKLGVIGVTSDMWGIYASFGVSMPPVLPIIREHAAQLREEGVDVVILLSHLGLDADRELAADLQNDIPLIIGSHSHHLLPEGERAGNVFIIQAGEYAQYLGQLELLWNGEQLHIQRAVMLPVTEDIPPSPRVMDAVAGLEVEAEKYLQGVIGELAAPLDYATDRECGAADLMADVLREYMKADVAIITAGVAFTGPLPVGSLRRITLWDVCSSSANPGVVTLTGAQLLAMVQKGLDPQFAQERPRPMRGLPRGLLHLSGARIANGHLLINNQPVDPAREYHVAASDFELEEYGGLVDPAWNLTPHYDVPTILREALEEYLARHGIVKVDMGRLAG